MDNVVIEIDGNTPILLDDPDVVFLVQSGKAEVYAVPLLNGKPAGRRTHLFRAELGQALFGLETEAVDGSIGLLVCGSPGTELFRRQRSRLLDAVRKTGDKLFAEPIIYLIESWIIGLSDGICLEMPPTKFRELAVQQIGTEGGLTIPGGMAVRPREDILWTKHITGTSFFANWEKMQLTTASHFTPLTEHTWLSTETESQFSVVATMDLVQTESDEDSPELWAGLAAFHRMALDCIGMNQQRSASDERVQLEKKAENDSFLLEEAFSHLITASGARGLDVKDETGHPMFLACQIIGDYFDVTLVPPPVSTRRTAFSAFDYLNNIARASHLQFRQVLLKGEWWCQDNGPLLAYREEDGYPVALLPLTPSVYELHDPVKQTHVHITADCAATLKPVAHMFYRSFPDRGLSLFDIIKFSMATTWKRDLVIICLMGITGGLLSLAIPVATGILFDNVIPSADRSQVWPVILLLLVGAGTGFIFQIVRAISMVRMENVMDVSLQAAVWDRLLNLPTAFFRDYTVGGLAVRVNGIAVIRRMISGAAAIAILSSLFSVFSLFLLFHYDVMLAFVAVKLVLFALIVAGVLGYSLLHYMRIMNKMETKISGLVVQLVGGIAKFRMAGAENRAYYLWAKEFSYQRTVTYKARTIGNYLTVFLSSYPMIATMVIFILMASSDNRLSTGNFLAFNSAFMSFLSSMLLLSSTFIVLAQVVPLYEGAKPIFDALPEVNEAKADPGELTGEIEVNHVSFRYKPDGPVILNDVSLTINPGEFIAIVGASGCGKSTLFRLLLGFDQPESGAIYYDGQDLDGIDVRYLRSQMGVVLQNGKLMAGPILNNIIGASNLGLVDAWEAAKMAGLEDDIRQMPMGMHTVLSEGGSTLSGGQRQRLLIARAIVKRPRILYFDEATSALDNKTQTIVSESLERLKSTRVVIAHRLSTIVNADRIYVMDKGQIIESGTYDELMMRDGMFAELARRQIA